METDANVAQLLTQLKRDEGMRLIIYDDADGAPLGPGSTIKGNPTIGIGRNLTGDGISEDEAEQLCLNDIRQRETAIVNALPWTATLDPVRFGVLVNVAFAGIGTLLEFRMMLAALQNGNLISAEAQLLNSRLAKEWGPRAERLALQLKSGVWQ